MIRLVEVLKRVLKRYGASGVQVLGCCFVLRAFEVVAFPLQGCLLH